MLNCTILGTDKSIVQKIKMYIENTPRLHLRKEEVKASSLFAIQSDILFIIDDKPVITEALTNFKGAVIMLSANEECSIKQGFLVIRKLLLTYQLFLDTIREATGLQFLPVSYPHENSFFIQTGQYNERIKLYHHEIYYIKALSNYVEIQCAINKYVTYISMTEIHRQLFCINKFIRIHRSYIINIDHIFKVEGGRVLLVNSTEIPIGGSYKEGFYKFLDIFTLKFGHVI